MREGFVYMVRTPWLLATLLFASIMVLVMMGPLEVLVPFLIKDKLGGGPGDHALVMAAFGIGGAVGLDGRSASVRMPRRYLTWMNLMWGVGCLPFLRDRVGRLRSGWSSPRPSCWVRCSRRRWSSGAPCCSAGCRPQLLGRVASLDFFVSMSLMPVSMALAGPVADADRPAQHLRDRRASCRGVVGGRGDRVGEAAGRRDRAPVA